MLPIRWLFFIAIPLGILFIFFPQIDLEVSSWFYDAEKGGFYLRQQPVLYFIFKFITYFTRVLIGYFVITLILNLILKKKFIFDNRQIIFLMLALAIGPGLLTNHIFKDNWQRARPSQIVEFGNTKTFTPAFVMTDQCEKNCSFISGHASMGFYLIAFAMLLKGRKKKIAYSALFGFATIVSLGRVMQGQHFLSDVIFGAIFTLITVHAVYLAMYHYKFEHKFFKKNNP